MPELEAAKLSGWDGRFRFPAKTLMPATVRWLGQLAGGTTIQQTFSLTVPVAGYYRIAALLTDSSSTPVLANGHFAQSTAYEEAWLYVDEGGGAITSTFEPGRLGPQNEASPGPRRSRSGIAQAPAQATASLVSGGVTYQFLYYDRDLAQYIPLNGAYYSLTYHAGSYPLGYVTGSESGWTASAGYASFACRSNEWYDGGAQTYGTRVRTSPIEVYNMNGMFNAQCNTLQVVSRKL